jgi:hypothetical protein
MKLPLVLREIGFLKIPLFSDFLCWSGKAMILKFGLVSFLQMSACNLIIGNRHLLDGLAIPALQVQRVVLVVVQVVECLADQGDAVLMLDQYLNSARLLS